MKKTARFAATAGILVTMFSSVACAVVSPHDPGFRIYNNDSPLWSPTTARPTAPQWGIEHEEQMRRDVKAFVKFMLNKIMPVMQNGDSLVEGVTIDDPIVQKRYAFKRQKFEMFDRLLGGCYGEPGLADYAWAANIMASWDQVGNEMRRIKDHAKGQGYKSSLRQEEWQHLDKEFKSHYKNNIRWVWDLNNAFFEQHPEVKKRLEDFDYEGYAIERVFASSAEGSAKIISSSAEHAFATHSRFMADPAFAARIKAMNDTPVMEYRKKDQESQEKENKFLQPSVLQEFDHSMACKKPAP